MASITEVLLLLIFSRCIFSLNPNYVNSQLGYEVLIAYQDSTECRQFIKNHFSDLTLKNNQKPNKNSLFSIESIRSFILPLILGYNLNGVVERNKSINFETIKYPFYDKTTARFASGNPLFVNGIPDVIYNELVGEFKWLKHIEMDRVKLPNAIDGRKFEEYLKSIPCVGHTDALTFRTVSLSSTSPDDNFRKLIDKDITSFDHRRLGVPNDPDFSLQWYINRISAITAWDLWTGPDPTAPISESVVGVIDSGCKLNHPDLKDRFWKNPGEICDDGVDNDNNGYVDDCHGWNFYDRNADLTDAVSHGTPVASAITATANNEIGIAGTCWTCQIMCLKIAETKTSITAFVEALNYAKGWNVPTVNYSVNHGYSTAEKLAIYSASKSNMLVVGSAGNSGCDLDSSQPCVERDGYPPTYQLPNYLAVGATDSFDAPAPFSNYGQHSVAVFAPGKSLFLASSKEAVLYELKTGTSLSAPLVAGVVGLIRSKHPELNYTAVIECIVSTCRHIPALVGKAKCPGVIDANAALRCAAAEKSFSGIEK